MNSHRFKFKSVIRAALLVLSAFWLPICYASEDPEIIQQLQGIEGYSLAAEETVLGLVKATAGHTQMRAKIKLAEIYRNSSQHDKALALFDELDRDLKKFPGREIEIRIILAKAHFEKGRNNYNRAVELAEQQALPLAYPDSPMLPWVYKGIGLFYRYQMKLADAKRYYFLALPEFEKSGDEESLASLYGNIGVLYETFGDLAESAKYQQKARIIFERLGNRQELATSYYNLGEIYYRSKDLDQALEYFKRALVIDTEMNSLQDVGYDHHRISTIYMIKQEYQLALNHTQQAVELFINESASQVLSRAYAQQAKIYAHLELFDQQLESLKLAEKAALGSEAEHQIRAVWYRFGEYYLAKSELELALEYGLKAMALSDKLDLSVHQHSDNLLLATLYQKLGQFELAYGHMAKAFEIEQKLNSDKQIRELEKHKKDINLLEEQIKVSDLEKQKNEQSKLLQVQQASNQRNFAIFIGALVVFVILIYLLLQKRRLALVEARLYEDALQQKNQLLADVSHELRTPLTALKLQIDALQHRIVKDVDVSYQKLSVKVMDINRLITDIYELAKTDSGELSLELEEQDIMVLLADWQTEFGGFVQAQGFTWRYMQNVISAKGMVDSERLKQVLSNIIANSCFYTDKPGVIELVVKRDDNWLYLSLNDSAPGVAEEDLTKIFNRLYRVEKSRNRQTGGSGLGLAICQSLVRSHGGDIIARNSPHGGLSVKIKLPLVKVEN